MWICQCCCRMLVRDVVAAVIIWLCPHFAHNSIANKQYRQSQQAHDPRGFMGKSYALTTSKSATVLCHTDWKEENGYKIRCNNEVAFDISSHANCIFACYREFYCLSMLCSTLSIDCAWLSIILFCTWQDLTDDFFCFEFINNNSVFSLLRVFSWLFLTFFDVLFR